MANAKQCDRCKAFYTKNTLHKTCGRISDGIVAGIKTFDKRYDCDKMYDLCDSCLTDLSLFLHNYAEGDTDHG